MQKIVVICGPTSSGKTKLALQLAKAFKGEIISADSRQIYKDLDIGTNKGSLDLKDKQYYDQGIPIHLVNIVSPDERYSVYDFKRNCEQKIKDLNSNIESKAKSQPDYTNASSVMNLKAESLEQNSPKLNAQSPQLIFIVGGTGLYIDSIYRNYNLQDNVENTYQDLTIEDLRKLYKEKYPEEFAQLNKSDQSNPRRLSMHLSKLDLGISLVQNKNKNYEFLFLYPTYEREALRERIHNRVEEMFAEGLVEETSNAKNKYGENSIALQGIGYAEVLDLLNGTISEEECIEHVKNAHWQYAKRQITWFEGEGRAYPLNVVRGLEDALAIVTPFLEHRIAENR